MTGSAHTDQDIPEHLSYLGSIEDVNGDAAEKAFKTELNGRPALVLRVNTVIAPEGYGALRIR